MQDFEKRVENLITDNVRLAIDLRESKAREAKLVEALKEIKPNLCPYDINQKNIKDIIEAALALAEKE